MGRRVKLPAAIRGKEFSATYLKQEQLTLLQYRRSSRKRAFYINQRWLKRSRKRQLLNKQKKIFLSNQILHSGLFIQTAQYSPAAGFISCLYMYAYTHMVFSSHYADNLRKFGPKSWRLMHHSRSQTQITKAVLFFFQVVSNSLAVCSWRCWGVQSAICGSFTDSVTSVNEISNMN